MVKVEEKAVQNGKNIGNYLDNHYLHRCNWLRAAVLGVNDGILSIASQAAFASGASFTVGGILPLVVVLFLPLLNMEYYLYGFALIFLIILESLSAKTGGSSIGKAVLRITFWGTVAMGLTALVGSIFNVNVG